jgi:hypothetical protein
MSRLYLTSLVPRTVFNQKEPSFFIYRFNAVKFPLIVYPGQKPVSTKGITMGIRLSARVRTTCLNRLSRLKRKIFLCHSIVIQACVIQACVIKTHFTQAHDTQTHNVKPHINITTSMPTTSKPTTSKPTTSKPTLPKPPEETEMPTYSPTMDEEIPTYSPTMDEEIPTYSPTMDERD